MTGAIETELSDLLIKDGTRIKEKQGEQEAKVMDRIANKITNELYRIFSLSPRRLIKKLIYIYLLLHSRLSPRKCVKSRKFQSVVGLEVVATLSNAQGSKSRQE